MKRERKLYAISIKVKRWVKLILQAIFQLKMTIVRRRVYIEKIHILYTFVHTITAAVCADSRQARISFIGKNPKFLSFVELIKEV